MFGWRILDQSGSDREQMIETVSFTLSVEAVLEGMYDSSRAVSDDMHLTVVAGLGNKLTLYDMSLSGKMLCGLGLSFDTAMTVSKHIV